MLGGVVFLAAAGVLFGSAAGCDVFASKTCPPADPPVSAKYLDDRNIKITFGSDAGSDTLNYGLVAEGDVRGGRITHQYSSKSLELEIEVDPTAKTLSADVPLTCAEGADGKVTVIVQIPVTHVTGDALPVTIQ